MIERKKIKKDGFKVLLANWNLIIILIGYPLIAVFLIPFFGNSSETTRIVTIPFRFFTLSLSLVTLFLHIKNKIKINIVIKVFLFFWVLVLLRMFYDLELRIDYGVPAIFKNQMWLTTLGIVFIPMISVMKSFNSINFRDCLKYIQYIGVVTLLVGFISFSENASNTDRILGTALDPISFGQLGGVVSLLSILLLKRHNSDKKILNLFYYCSILLGVFVSLRTGSRGPIMAFIIGVFCFYTFRSKYILKTVLKIGIPLIIIMFMFSGLLINVVGYISPVFEARLTEAIRGEDLSTNNRKESYQWFWSEIQDNIFTGSQFARLSNTEYPEYAHNIFLDILLGFGFIGLILFLFVLFKTIYYVRLLVLYNSDESWIGLLAIQYIVVSLFSGAYYSNPTLNISIILVLLAGASYPKNYEYD